MKTFASRLLLLALVLGLLAPKEARTDAPQWVVVDGRPHLALEDWHDLTGFKPFPDPKSGRILLERKGHAPLLLLLGAPYALQSGRFLALPQAPWRRGDKILLSLESGERLFLPSLKKDDRAALAKRLLVAKGSAPCELERPVKRIFLDPGHGGDDSGTTHGALKEKDIVLTFARLTADELRRHGFDVSFSRTKDVFLPLDVRTKIAEKWKADIFISLHVNSSPHPRPHGTETYILSQDATDAEARRLALLENSIAEKARASESAVQDILWDMEQTAYLQDSAYLASYLQESLVDNAHQLLLKKKEPGDWKNRGVRQAPFYVLSRAAMPAVLVELGYLSHDRDRKLLAQKFFQESLAKALADGVKKYKEACRTR